MRSTGLHTSLLCSALLAIATDAVAGEFRTSARRLRSNLKQLEPGDTLILEPDDYADGLPVVNVNGRADAWITIRGPAEGDPAVFYGDRSGKKNTVTIRDSSYVAIENIVIDGDNIDGIFGIHAKGKDVHHIRIEGCTIREHGASQGTAAISSKVPTWGWIIRRNRIIGAGTGMYLGNSDGHMPFVAGLIEQNLIRDSRGYNIQIKHQIGRPDLPGMPKEPSRTIIRHNVFIKGGLEPDRGPRPSLLLGGFPPDGPGSQDMYEVYGNVFYRSLDESLIQATGRVSIHDNLFLDCPGNDAINLRDHNGPLRLAFVYNNTFYVGGRGIHVVSRPRERLWIAGNLILMDAGVVGTVAADQSVHNIWERPAESKRFVRRPSITFGQMDFAPVGDAVGRPPIGFSPVDDQTDYGRDFDGLPKGEGKHAGAFAPAPAGSKRWPIDIGIKTLPNRRSE